MKLMESGQEMGKTHIVIAGAGLDGNLDVRSLERIANLEAEVAALRAEVQMLRASQLRGTGGQIRERFDTDFICETR